ncbi:MAG TPA: GNAT family N-acetyltransferase [Chloroflexota bacterium]|nr:GNAT family N-acetyltransferase [Chloroflexota bacterium]
MSRPDDGSAPIVEITPEQVGTIRIGLTSRLDRHRLTEHVRRYPGYAYSTERGQQYVVAGPWRRRPEIAEIVEATRGERRLDLIEALVRSLAGRGIRLLVLDYGVEALDPAFYRRAGFNLVERIVEYERPNCTVERRPRPSLRIRQYRAADRDQVLDLEHESFEWLWWNSGEEWDSYIAAPNVEIIVGCTDERIVGYAGFTVNRRDGHLDRLAVRSSDQGRGYGSGLLVEALARMETRGARRVALTTQEHNGTSQALYERYGFHRGRWTYSIHGRWLNPEDLRS